MDSPHIDRMGRLLRFLRDHQITAGVAPLKTRMIARAIEVSHTQTGRLLARAEEQGLIRRTAGGYAFEKIVVQEEIEGKRWLPIATCNWRSPIKFPERERNGEWLPMSLFGIRPRGDLWLIKFTADQPEANGYPYGLGPNCMVIVRRLKDPQDAKVNDWCLVESAGRVKTMFREARGRFVHTRGRDLATVPVPMKKVAHAAVIEMMIQQRNPVLNRQQRHVSEAVGHFMQSEDFQNQDCDPGCISICVEKLRRTRRVAHQMSFPQLFDA